MKVKRLRPILIFLSIAVVMAGIYMLLPAPHGRHKPARVQPSRLAGKGKGEIVPSAAAPLVKEKGPKKAEIAIIIDDMGQDLGALDKVLHLDAPVAVAVLPHLVHSEETAMKAEAAGREVLLHLPMQPLGRSMKGLGPGALMEGMGRDAIEKVFAGDIATVPGASGVNNHMGSALTEDRAAMDVLMAVLKGRDLFFVDSRTSPKSLGYEAAREAGVKTASRKIFLDDSLVPADIRRQLARLVSAAKKGGSAIAIGHPRPETLSVLAEELPDMHNKGLEVVKVSELLVNGPSQKR
ncbi:MAG: divergent polysaccharide deacetylase family protein [Nitrospirota bacterium]